jgi:hypothetical protein
MSEELIVFLNFKFENNLVTTKILDDASLKLSTASRYQLNWRAYLMALEKIGVYADSDRRPLSHRYLSPQSTDDLFNSLISFQEELRGMLTEIVSKQRVSRSYWKKIFRESDSLTASVSPPINFDTDITTDNIDTLKLRLNYDSQTYRACIMANLRDIIVSGRVFQIGVAKDGVFFIDPAKAPPSTEHGPVLSGHGKDAAIVAASRPLRPVGGDQPLELALPEQKERALTFSLYTAPTPPPQRDPGPAAPSPTAT